jgi:hypothetical protein
MVVAWEVTKVVQFLREVKLFDGTTLLDNQVAKLGQRK